jgi:hypothetical protein
MVYLPTFGWFLGHWPSVPPWDRDEPTALAMSPPHPLQHAKWVRGSFFLWMSNHPLFGLSVRALEPSRPSCYCHPCLKDSRANIINPPLRMIFFSAHRVFFPCAMGICICLMMGNSLSTMGINQWYLLWCGCVWTWGIPPKQHFLQGNGWLTMMKLQIYGYQTPDTPIYQQYSIHWTRLISGVLGCFCCWCTLELVTLTI